MVRISAAASKIFCQQFFEYTGNRLEVKDAADTIALIRDTLGKRKLATLRAQKDLLKTSLVPIKQLILEKAPSCGNEVDWDEWSGALWELYVAAVNQTGCGRACIDATEDEPWQEVVEATLGETQDDVETLLPVWWTERTVFSSCSSSLVLRLHFFPNLCPGRGVLLSCYW